MQVQNIYDLLSAIDNADGLYELVRDGMTDIESFDVPDDLKEIWDDLAYDVANLRIGMDQVQHLLNTYVRYYDEHHSFDAFKDNNNDA